MVIPCKVSFSHFFLAYFPFFRQRECSSLTFLLRIFFFWSERVLLTHFSPAYFLFLVRESAPHSLFSCVFSFFGQRECSSLTFLLRIFFFSQRECSSLTFLAYFPFLVRESAPHSLFCVFSFFGQRECSSLTFLLRIFFFWSERVLFTHFSLCISFLVRESAPHFDLKDIIRGFIMKIVLHQGNEDQNPA